MFTAFAIEMEMKIEPSSPTDKRQQFSRCSSTNSVITSNSSAQNSGKCVTTYTQENYQSIDNNRILQVYYKKT